ncbi:MAG: 16S rRNA processing protein RimM [Clostridia bacterium]|nr:16S rRNA processing protein RimM [Clostridia bacterium]
MNLLEVGKILRPHGIKGAVKVECFVDVHFSMFNQVFVTEKRAKAQIKNVQNLNGDFYIVTLDIIPDVDTAEKFRNQSIYIDRDLYPEFKNQVYLSDLINKPVLNEKGEQIGYMVDYEDYGASVILTIKAGFTSYQIPYVKEIVEFVDEKDAFVINQQTFEDVRV